ncbi:MAG TPA: acyl-CoA thioesterase [Devosia sp.]|nr:acyl-CoA thioesterase [Devosia sp.]
MSRPKEFPALESFPFRSRQQLRFADTDAVGHVNNAIFATLFEAARVEFLFEPGHPVLSPGTQFVVARIAIDFVGELNWPGNVHVGSRIARVGNSSFDLFQAMYFQQKCVAVCDSVIVVMDQTTRKSSPLGAELSAYYRACLGSGEA